MYRFCRVSVIDTTPVRGLMDYFFAPSQADRFVNLGFVVHGCFSSDLPRIMTVFAVPPLLTAYVMFCLILYKCMANLRMGIRRRMPIISLFLRDGIVWFILVHSVMVATLVNWAVGRATLCQITEMPRLIAYSMLSSHALLNVKSVLRECNPTISRSVHRSDYEQDSEIFRQLDQVLQQSSSQSLPAAS